MTRLAEVVVAGHICLDIIPTLATPTLSFDPGRLVEVGPAVLGTGGPVSNTGLALHRLGVSTRLLGKVGDDLFGRAIRDLIARADPTLADGLIQSRGEASAYSVILSPPGADRMFLHCPGCNDTFAAADVDSAALEGARVFHFGYPPAMRRIAERGGEELVELLRRARAAGATVSLDMTMPDPSGFSGRVDWRGVLERALPYVDLYFPSLDETLFMLYPAEWQSLVRQEIRPERLDRVARELLALGPALVGLKLGALGLYLQTGDEAAWRGRGRGAPRRLEPWFDRQLWSGCFEVTVAGTTGAGDATIAGFLAALLGDNGPEECATLACAVGACSVEAADAVSGVRSLDETQARLRAGWTRRPLPADAADWSGAGGGVRRGPSDSGRAREAR